MIYQTLSKTTISTLSMDCENRLRGWVCEVTILRKVDFQPGHVTSSVTWPFDSPYAISYWWSLLLCNGVFKSSRFRDMNDNDNDNGFLIISRPRVWPFKVMWRHRSRDHLIVHVPFPIGGLGTKPLSLTVSEIFNVKCNAMVVVTLIRPLNNGQGHSFWYQSISYIRLPIGCQ